MHVRAGLVRLATFLRHRFQGHRFQGHRSRGTASGATVAGPTDFWAAPWPWRPGPHWPPRG